MLMTWGLYQKYHQKLMNKNVSQRLFSFVQLLTAPSSVFVILSELPRCTKVKVQTKCIFI